MPFFEDTFGFEETSYNATKEALRAISTFSTVSEADLGLHRPLVATEGSEDGATAPLPPTDAETGHALKRTLSSDAASAEESSAYLVGERCVMEPTNNALGFKTLDAGVFSTPSVGELRKRADRLCGTLTPFERQELAKLATTTFGRDTSKLLNVRHVIGDSRALHSELVHHNSVMQAASQFNYLEFPSPNTTPENGISGYVFDRTQGPACATACAAGTAYRNYLVPVGGPHRRGQTHASQLDGLLDLTTCLTTTAATGPSSDNEADGVDVVASPLDRYYTVKNGYVDSTAKKLVALNRRLAAEEHMIEERLIPLLRVGVQEDTQVTDEGAGCENVKYTDEATGRIRWKKVPVDGYHPAKVTQVYCSALSVGYSRVQSFDASGSGPWDRMAQLVLHGTYEATFLVSVIQAIKLLRTGQHRGGRLHTTLLTKVGGGVFQNEPEWIIAAMHRAARRVVAAYRVPLDVGIVHYGCIENEYRDVPTDMMAAVAQGDGGSGGCSSL